MQIRLLNLFQATLLAACASLTTFAQSSSAPPTVAEVLSRARAAIGGETKLLTTYSLSLTAKLRRFPPTAAANGASEPAGMAEMDFVLPDRFRKSETAQFHDPAREATFIEVLDGARYWSDVRASGDSMGVFFAAEPIAGAGANNDIEAERLRNLRGQFARHLLALLLTAPATFPVTWSYIGETEADGQRADELEARGADGFSARMLFDQRTHLPLQISYRAKAFTLALGTPVQEVNLVASGTSGPALGVRIIAVSPATTQTANEHFIKVAPLPAHIEMDALQAETEMVLRLSDYRNVDGLRLPHRWTNLAQNTPENEWEITGYKINQPAPPEKFQQPRKP